MTDIDQTAAARQTAETPSPSPSRPDEGATAAHADHGSPPEAGAAHADHSAPEAGEAPVAGPDAHDANGAATLQGDLDELVEVAAQRDEYLALAQRTQADFENYRKRVAREAAAAQERGMAGLAKELLPALDNLDRALDSAEQDDPLLNGVRLVRSELGAALSRAGIESFNPHGEPFDPSLHEAVATAPAGDGAAAGIVIEVYQNGYRLGESILRPARVVVSA